MSEKSGAIVSIVSLTGAIQLIFILLKIFKLITWKWWVVFLPFEIETFLVTVPVIVAVIYYACCDLLDRKRLDN